MGKIGDSRRWLRIDGERLADKATVGGFGLAAARKRRRGSVAVYNTEESPDRKRHPAAESADGSNLLEAVTENYRPKG